MINITKIIEIVVFNAERPQIRCDQKYKSKQFIKAGSSLVVDADVTGLPAPLVDWKHGDTELMTSGNMTVEKSSLRSTLTIRNLTKEDSGHYTVTASNKAGTATFEFDIVVQSMSSVPHSLFLLDSACILC